MFHETIPPWADACIGIWMNLLGIELIHDNRFNRGFYKEGERKTTIIDGKAYFSPGEGEIGEKPSIKNDLITCHFVKDFYGIYDNFNKPSQESCK